MSENIKKLRKLVVELYKCHSLLDKTKKALVLFNIGGSYVAVSSDADKIYLMLGWEISDFTDNDGAYSYMVISSKGLHILRYLLSNLEIHKFEHHCHILDATVTSSQQTLDYMRLLIGHNELCFPIVNHYAAIEEVGFIREVRLSSIIINAQAVSVCIDNGELVELVKNHEWNFSHIGLTLLSNLSDIIQEQVLFMVDLIQVKAQTLKKQRVQNTSLYELFVHKKHSSPHDTMVFIKVENKYITFDDDAIKISSLINNVLLYECNVFGLRGRTVALLSILQLNTAKKDNNCIVIESPINIPLYMIGLKESFLNKKCNAEIVFSDVVVRKQKGGNYIISANYNGINLPETPIMATIGGYYHNLPICEEKKAILFSLVHHTYDHLICNCISENP